MLQIWPIDIILFFYAHGSAYYSNMPAYYSNLLSQYADKESMEKKNICNYELT